MTTAMQSSSLNLVQSLRRDPKKSGALLLLLVVLLALLLIRLLGGGPAIALADGEAGKELGVHGAAPVPNISRAARLGAQWQQNPVPHTTRNIFASELNTPPPKRPDPVVTAQQNQREEDGLFWRQLQRALAERADREEFRRMLADRVVKDAATLSLSSIVTGPETRAMIGGKLLSVGDLVSSGSDGGPFTVVAIESRRVILARDSHRVVLTMGESGAQLIQHQ